MTHRRTTTPRCINCGAPVEFLGSPFTPANRPFNPGDLNGRTTSVPDAYPVLGRRAWRFPALVEHLQWQRGCSQADAEDEARDMPWRQLHTCTPTTDHQTGGTR